MKEYLEISLILEYFNDKKRENFVVLKNFNELKNVENNYETWKIKDFEIFVKYDFRTNVFIESPKKPLRNRIPMPGGTNEQKKKVSRHDSLILESNAGNLKKISLRKNSDGMVRKFFINFYLFFILNLLKEYSQSQRNSVEKKDSSSSVNNYNNNSTLRDSNLSNYSNSGNGKMSLGKLLI